MNLKEAQSMDTWQLSLLSLFLLINTTSKTIWQRKKNSLKGIVRSLLRIIKYNCAIIIFSILLNWEARLIFSIYTWFRKVDDIMDGDAEPPINCDKKLYLDSKKEIISFLPIITDYKGLFLEEDVLLIYILRIAKSRDLDIIQEFKNLWQVMLWDDERREQKTIPCQNELNNYASLQDNSILEICVKIFDGDINSFQKNFKIVSGIFSKTDWLADINEDLQKGTINIPEESLRKYNININKLLSCKSYKEVRGVPGFINWYRDEFKKIKIQWSKTTVMFDKNLNKIFYSRLPNIIFHKMIIEEFQIIYNKLTNRLNEQT